MMHPRRTGVLLFAILISWTMLVGSVYAQGGIRLEAKELTSAEKTIISKLREGQIDSIGTEQKAAIEKAAKWNVNRLTWKEHQKRGPETPGVVSPIPINDLVQGAFYNIIEAKKMHPKVGPRDNQKRFLVEYCKAMSTCIDEVMTTPLPDGTVARINAARVLAHFGKSGLEEAADPMLKILEDKEQLDAVKLYILRGFTDLFETTGRFKDAEREIRCVKAIIAFMNRPRTTALPKDATIEQVDGFRYLRREAIKALAQVKASTLISKRVVVARPAFELLRVVGKDGFDPEPSISEQTEAAIGVCLVPKDSKDYQIDYAAFIVCQFIGDFIAKTNVQEAIRSEPWKILSARLDQAIGVMNVEKSDKFVATMAPKVQGLLRDLIAGKPVASDALRDWLKSNTPKSTSLFKNDETSVIKLPAGDM